MAWKTIPAGFELRLIESLQWGHALMAWKTMSGNGWHLLYRIASMGPRFNGVEDPAGASVSADLAAVLQWGHALMAWKTVHQLRPQQAGKRRFNGATL